MLMTTCLVVSSLLICAHEDLRDDRPKSETLILEVGTSTERDGKRFLDVVLTNNSTMPIIMYRSSLPWTRWICLRLCAVRARTATIVAEGPEPIQDAGAARVVVQPKEKIRGKVSLNERFPDLDKAVKDEDVIVFWSYQPDLIDAPTGGKKRCQEPILDDGLVGRYAGPPWEEHSVLRLAAGSTTS
jgi:hypothetical protein